MLMWCWFLAGASPAHAEVLSGQVRATDGDSLRMGSWRIRIHGIDAPEARQYCFDDQGKKYECGLKATEAMTAMTEGKKIDCQKLATDRYGRVVAKCFADGKDLGGAMVEQGWAVAYRRYAMDYVHQEDDARQAGRGLWQGTFLMPWECRRKKNCS